MECDLNNYTNLGRPLYRTRKERKQIQKLDKTNWFRSEGATATITVPSTRNSTLAKELGQKLIGTGPRGTQVKVIEKPGPLIMSGLARNNPFKRRSCGRPKCPLFLAGNRCNEQCYKEGILYAASCNRCHQSPLDAGLDPKKRITLERVAEHSTPEPSNT